MLIERDQVLDFGSSAREAWTTDKTVPKEFEMFDQGAIGTAIIGLDAIRREDEMGDLTTAPLRAPSENGTGFRAALANALRGLADLLEPHRPAASSPGM